MPTVETGFFVLILVIASIFTFGAFRAVGNVKGILHIVALALFIALGVFGTSGYEVSSTSTSQEALDVNGTFTTYQKNSTQIFIEGGEDSAWFGYVFMGLAMLNLVLFVKDVWRAE